MEAGSERRSEGSITKLAKGIAASFDPRRIVAAAIGLLSIRLIVTGLDMLFPGAASGSPRIAWDFPAAPWDQELGSFFRAAAFRSLEPVRVVFEPFWGMFAIGRGTTFFVRSALVSLATIVVWSLTGGAIARIAVVEAAASRRVGLWEAYRYVLWKSTPLIGAPIVPILGFLVLACLSAPIGLLYRIDSPIAQTIAGVLFVVPLCIGIVSTLLILGLALAWPLMPAAIAAEGEDGFDAISRSYGYASHRTIRYAILWLIVWLGGTIGAAAAAIAARTVTTLAFWSLGVAAPDSILLDYRDWTPDAGLGTAGSAHAFWLSVVALAVYAWSFAYFWTQAGLIYLVLRGEVDGTRWNDVAAGDRPKIAPVETEPRGETKKPSGSPSRDESIDQ
jgi:hypothetical protein